MPAMTKKEREGIESSIRETLRRLDHAQRFPLVFNSVENVVTFMLEHAIDPTVAKCVKYLLARSPDTVSMRYYTEVRVGEEDRAFYKLHIAHQLPSLDTQIFPYHELYEPVMAFCHATALNEALSHRATSYLVRCLRECSTVGHIKTVMPFLTDYLSEEARAVVAQAKRASPMPKDFTHDYNRLEEAHNALAMACLLPRRPEIYPTPHRLTAPDKTPQKSPWTSVAIESQRQGAGD